MPHSERHGCTQDYVVTAARAVPTEAGAKRANLAARVAAEARLEQGTSTPDDLRAFVSALSAAAGRLAR